MNVYDFDKTIYQKDSTTGFFIFSMKRHPEILLLIPSILVAFVKFYIFKKGTKTQFKSQIFKFVKHIDYDKDINAFWEKHKKGIKSFYMEQKSESDVIISASPRFVLAPICKELGIKHLICSEVDVKSGKYKGENCHGKEKVRRFRELYPNASIDKFYSDSYSDSPLAEISAEAFMIKGDKISPWKYR